jgi:hypothetical protein
MKVSLGIVLFACLFIGLVFAWFCEHRRVGELQSEIEQLNFRLEPEYFAYAYHPNPDRSMFPNDPLSEADSQTGTLYKALVTQPDAWSTGLIQYLGIDRIRNSLEPDITMTVWWHGEIKDSEGNTFFAYLADRERTHAKSADRLHDSFSAYVVTDSSRTLTHWSGSKIDKSLVTDFELVDATFPAGVTFREESRHNGDSSIERRTLTKSGIIK